MRILVVFLKFLVIAGIAYILWILLFVLEFTIPVRTIPLLELSRGRSRVRVSSAPPFSDFVLYEDFLKIHANIRNSGTE